MTDAAATTYLQPCNLEDDNIAGYVPLVFSGYARLSIGSCTNASCPGSGSGTRQPGARDAGSADERSIRTRLGWLDVPDDDEP